MVIYFLAEQSPARAPYDTKTRLDRLTGPSRGWGGDAWTIQVSLVFPTAEHMVGGRRHVSNTMLSGTMFPGSMLHGTTVNVSLLPASMTPVLPGSPPSTVSRSQGAIAVNSAVKAHCPCPAAGMPLSRRRTKLLHNNFSAPAALCTSC